MRTSATFMGALAAALVLTACGGTNGGTSTTDTTDTGASATATSAASPTGAASTSATPSPTATATTGAAAGAAAYLMLDASSGDEGGPYLVPVWVPDATALPDALTAVLEGPAVLEGTDAASPAIGTEIPDGTSLAGVSVDGGTATVNLSATFDDGGGSATMFARLAQIVFTATQFPDVDKVAFQLDGEDVTTFSSEGIEIGGGIDRSFFEGTGVLPRIFLDRPAWGQRVTTPFSLTGRARDLFEATFQYEITDGDQVLHKSFVTAEGSQGWNGFDEPVDFTVDHEQQATISVIDESAEDGSITFQREYPVTLLPGS